MLRFLAGLVLFASVAAGCSHSAESPPASPVVPATSVVSAGPTGSSGEPDTLEAATAAAQELADRRSSGDFEGEWLLMSKQYRDNVSQDTFAIYNKACYATKIGLPTKVSGVRLDADAAVARMELLGVKVSRKMVYEDGRWVLTPTEDQLQQFGKSADELIARRRAEGKC